MKDAIKIAIEGGWKVGKDYSKIQDPVLKRGYECLAVLDKTFWQALGKAMGWNQQDMSFAPFGETNWTMEWHRFIDHLAEGGDAESFFKDLLAHS